MKSKATFLALILIALLTATSLFIFPTQQETEQPKLEQEIQQTDWTHVTHTQNDKSREELHNALTRHVRELDSIETASPCRDTDKWQLYVSAQLSDSNKTLQIVPDFDSENAIKKITTEDKYNCHSVTTEADYNGPAYGL